MWRVLECGPPDTAPGRSEVRRITPQRNVAWPPFTRFHFQPIFPAVSSPSQAVNVPAKPAFCAESAAICLPCLVKCRIRMRNGLICDCLGKTTKHRSRCGTRFGCAARVGTPVCIKTWPTPWVWCRTWTKNCSCCPPAAGARWLWPACWPAAQRSLAWTSLLPRWIPRRSRWSARSCMTWAITPRAHGWWLTMSLTPGCRGSL